MTKWLSLLIPVFIISCGDKKSSLSGNDIVDVSDFVEAFTEMKLPTVIYDTGLHRIGDTLNISHAVFTQFIPDSLVPMKEKLIINPVGRIEKENEKYLLAKIQENKMAKLGVFVFDNDNRFLGGKELLIDRNKEGYRQFVNISREPTFNLSREKIKNNQQYYTRTGYAFNKDAGFVVVVNDSNEDTERRDTVLNPIDTLKRLNPLSGDYLKDAKNFISLRDGKNEHTYLFFIHFEKSKGECVGELKGEMIIKDDKTGQYTAAGDPCVINFKFSGSQIKVKEEGTCGNHRGIKCFFDDTYSRKKVTTPKLKKRR